MVRMGGKRVGIALRRRVYRRNRLENEALDSALLVFALVSALVVLFCI